MRRSMRALRWSAAFVVLPWLVVSAVAEAQSAKPAAGAASPPASSAPTPPAAPAPAAPSQSATGQSGQRAAAAQALFEDGRTLMKAGKYAAACPKFEASQKLDPGAGTLLNLADCYQKLGRTASAWAQYIEAATESARVGAEARARFARGRASALVPKLVRLTINVDPTTQKLTGLVVELDSIRVDPATFGVATPVDPGKHVISAMAPGKKPWKTTVDVEGEGKTVSTSVPALANAPAPKKPAPKPVAAPKPAPKPAPLPPGNPHAGLERTLGIVVGSVGLVAVGVGGALGLSARSKWNSANCPDLVCRTAKDQDLAVSAKHTADAATVTMAAGGVLFAGGVVLYIMSHSSSSSPAKDQASRLQVLPAFGPHGGQVSLFKRF